jgi:hypothetical protein
MRAAVRTCLTCGWKVTVASSVRATAGVAFCVCAAGRFLAAGSCTATTLPAAPPIAGSTGIGPTTAPGRKNAANQIVPAAATTASAVREAWAYGGFISD